MRSKLITATLIACGLSLTSFTGSSLAQDYPQRGVIKMLVGFTAGGGTDVMARLIAEQMTQNLGQDVIVENLPGAGGSIATQAAVSAEPDGYTLLFMPNSGTVLPALEDLPFDTEKDLQPISLIGTAPMLMVINAEAPAQTVQELVELAKAEPGTLNYGSNGAGTSTHLAGALFVALSGLDIVHIPYNGDVVVATASGEVDFSFTSISSGLPLMSAGKLRALAVTTKDRSPALPDVPSLIESGIEGYDHSLWYSVLAPAGLPEDVLSKLNQSVRDAVASEAIQKAMADVGMTGKAGSPEELAAFIRHELERGVNLVEIAGVKPE